LYIQFYVNFLRDAREQPTVMPVALCHKNVGGRWFKISHRRCDKITVYFKNWFGIWGHRQVAGLCENENEPSASIL